MPVTKTPAKNSAKPVAAVVSAAQNAPKPKGKVAVAVVSKKTDAPSPRNAARVVDYKVDDATGRPQLPKGYKPSTDEEYMSPLQQEYFRQRLLQWRADLSRRVQADHREPQG